MAGRPEYTCTIVVGVVELTSEIPGHLFSPTTQARAQARARPGPSPSPGSRGSRAQAWGLDRPGPTKPEPEPGYLSPEPGNH